MKTLKAFSVFVIGVVCSVCLFVPTDAQNASHELLYTDGNIYKVDTDRDVVTQLTDTSAYDSNPRWSPVGGKIAYIAGLTDDYYGQYGLYVMNEDGSNPVQIAADLVWQSEPIWLNNDVILYASGGEIKGRDCVIKSVKRDGSELHELFRRSHKACSVSGLSAVLSPDGTRILFGLDEQDDGKYFQLYVLTLVDGQLVKLTNDRANNTAPEWSPDGKQIAFVTNRDKQNEIYVMNADGSNPRRLTHRPGGDYAPHWLPDSEHIIFASDQDGYNLYSVDTNKGIVRNLTKLVDSSAWNVAVSPDGRQIAYATGIDPVSGPDHVDVMTLDSGVVRELANVGANAYALVWRPTP